MGDLRNGDMSSWKVIEEENNYPQYQYSVKPVSSRQESVEVSKWNSSSDKDGSPNITVKRRNNLNKCRQDHLMQLQKENARKKFRLAGILSWPLRALHLYRRGQGSNPAANLNFPSPSFRICYHVFIQQSRDLSILGRERLRIRDLTWIFLAYSQSTDSPKSFILPFFTKKVSTVTFSEGGYALFRSQNDKTSNIW